jgi:hypothetical protein
MGRTLHNGNRLHVLTQEDSILEVQHAMQCLTLSCRLLLGASEVLIGGRLSAVCRDTIMGRSPDHRPSLQRRVSCSSL